MSQQKARRIILTIGVAATTATGAWYGAGLKTKQELNHERKSQVEARPDDRIAQLERTKFKIMQSRAEVEKKIKEVEDRVASANGQFRP